jgi:hypothetical protein
LNAHQQVRAVIRVLHWWVRARHGDFVKLIKETLMLLWIAIIIAVLWLLGLLANIGGGLIHILLVVAVVVLIFHFVRGRSRV